MASGSSSSGALFANEFDDEDEQMVLQTSSFLCDAEQRGLWNSNTKYPSAHGLTIFVPEQYATGDGGDFFDELWRRQVVKGMVKIGGDAVQQLTTLSKLVVAVYPTASSSLDNQTDATHAVAGFPCGSFVNVEYNGCVFHSIAAAHISDLSPVPGQISTLRTCYISGETIDLRFGASGVVGEHQNFTLIVSFTCADRSPLGANQKMTWLGNGTPCRILVPSVTTQSNAMLWFSLYDNNLRHPILTKMHGWFLVLLPNVHMHSNPRISDISRKTGKPNQELWIKGQGFSNTSVRVTIGANGAQVYQCEPTLISCFIPPGSGTVPVWVANGNVYTRYDSFTYE